jgi:hypothetical protein
MPPVEKLIRIVSTSIDLPVGSNWRRKFHWWIQPFYHTTMASLYSRSKDKDAIERRKEQNRHAQRNFRKLVSKFISIATKILNI